MQLIFHDLPLASGPSLHPRFSEFFQREEARHLVTFVVAVLVGSQLVHILALWVASKAVAEKNNSTLGNAVKVWLFGILVAVGVLVALVITLILTTHPSDHGRIFWVVGGALLLWLLLAFLIPMKVYDFGFLHAFGLFLLAGCISGGVTTAVEALLIPALHLEKDIASLVAAGGKTPDEKKVFVARLIGVEAKDEINRLLDDALSPIGPQPSLADQEAMVRTIQQKLTARLNSLNGSDSHAVDVYQAQVKRYLLFRNQVLAARNKT